MNDFEKLSVTRPFGPSIGELIVKEEFVNDLNEYCKIVLNEEGRAEKLDVGKELAGQVKQEFEVDINFFNLKINNYLTNMIKDYLWKSLEKKNQTYQDFAEKVLEITKRNYKYLLLCEDKNTAIFDINNYYVLPRINIAKNDYKEEFLRCLGFHQLIKKIVLKKDYIRLQ